MSTIKVDTIATRTGSGNVTVSNNISAAGTLAVTGNASASTIALGGRSFNAGGTPLGVNFSSACGSGLHINDTNSGNLGGMMQFYSGAGTGTLRANIQNANNAGVHVCVGTGGSVVFTQNGYVAANALDDYEEGTYTPVLASTGCTFSYSVQLGSYVKVGNLVYLQFNITLSNRTGTTSNVVFLDNVPFNTKNVDNSLYSGGHIGHYFNVNLSAGTTMAYQIPAVSTNQIELKEVGDNIGENGLLASELNTNAVIRGSVLYRSV